MATRAPDPIAALVLAAGSATRFGSPKALAALGDKPILQHVLDAVAEAGIEHVVVVLGDAQRSIERGIAWRSERRVRNPDPARGLSSSLRDGLADLAAARPPVEAVLVLLGDQPLTNPSVIRALVEAAATSDRPVVAPRYSSGGGANPVLLRRAAFSLADRATGDRGLGPVLAEQPDLVAWVPVDGDNPDIDTPADLAALAWSERVRANRAQVDRFREVADGADFYAPVSSLFVADPRRTDEPVLAALRGLARPAETWLDIGAGAGRYALPLALIVREVIAVDPSPGMLDGLRRQAADHGIPNVRAIEGRWPPEPGGPLAVALGPSPVADVALIAHVGYDVEPIGAFVEAMEAAARRLCVAVLMERQPASVADPFWPRVHGEPRSALPALPEFVDLLRARHARPTVTMLEREPRRFASREELERFLRRQLWIADGGAKDARFRSALEELVVVGPDGSFGLVDQQPLPIGMVTWEPVVSATKR